MRCSQGGTPEQCGWLKDRYGLSWQIVPTVLATLMTDPDREKAKRVGEAMLKMVKLDIAGLTRPRADILRHTAFQIFFCLRVLRNERSELHEYNSKQRALIIIDYNSSWQICITR